jgi:hypothetical protein
MPNRMLILEFNELCPRLLARFMDEGVLPNFARLYKAAEIHTTTTDDADLEPWVQWITFHCGVRESVHGVRELDQGHTVRHPAIWDLAARRGLSSVVFGAMNAAPPRAEQVLMIPDPWSTHVPVPPEFRPYQDFIRTQVLGHTCEQGRAGQAAAFLAFMASHGLSRPTVRQLLGQLVSERTARRDVRWRRASCLDDLQWDLFRHLWVARRPDLAVFFSNSTAFLQHRYWRQMEPEAYAVKPSAESIAAYGGAIRYGHQKMDRLVGEALAMAGGQGTVVLATALSQQPNLRYEAIGGKFVYRPRDFRNFLDLLQIPRSITVEPVMTHQAWLTCRDEAQADECAKRLLELNMNGEAIMSASRVGARVYFDCKLLSEKPAGAVMTFRGKPFSFHRYFAFLGEVVNARHHRDGALWIHSPGGKHAVHGQKLELADAARLLLARLAPMASPYPDIASSLPTAT